MASSQTYIYYSLNSPGEKKRRRKRLCIAEKTHTFPAQPSPQALHFSSSPTDLQLYTACLPTSLAPGEESRPPRGGQPHATGHSPTPPAGSSILSTALPSCRPPAPPQVPQMAPCQLNFSTSVAPLYLLLNGREDLLNVVFVWAFNSRGTMSHQTWMKRCQSVKAGAVVHARQW